MPFKYKINVTLNSTLTLSESDADKTGIQGLRWTDAQQIQALPLSLAPDGRFNQPHFIFLCFLNVLANCKWVNSFKLNASKRTSLYVVI